MSQTTPIHPKSSIARTFASILAGIQEVFDKMDTSKMGEERGKRNCLRFAIQDERGSAGGSVPHDWPRRAKQTGAACRSTRNCYTGVAGDDQAVRPYKSGYLRRKPSRFEDE